MKTRLTFLQVLAFLWLLAFGSLSASWADDSTSQGDGTTSTATTEEVTFDFAADNSLLSGLANSTTDMVGEKADVTIRINNFPVRLYHCLRSGDNLQIRGDGSYGGYVSGSMQGTLVQLKFYIPKAYNGSMTLTLQDALGNTKTFTEAYTSAGEHVINVPEADQMENASLIKLAPSARCNISKIILVRKSHEQDYKDPWVRFKRWDGTEIPVSDEKTHDATIGEVLKIESRDIEGFDPVSTTTNPYVVVYTVNGKEPEFTGLTDQKGNWKSGTDKDADGNLIGKEGYVYRRGVILSNVHIDPETQQPTLDDEFRDGQKVTVKLAIYKVEKYADGTLKSATKIKDINKPFTLHRHDELRPKYGTEEQDKHITFTPGTIAALGSPDKPTEFQPGVTVLDPTEQILVENNQATVEPFTNNSIIAKFSHNDCYDLHSLFNSASVTPRKNKASMRSSTLKMRKISVMQMTGDGIASTTVVERYYWFVPARKQMVLEATMEPSTIDMEQEATSTSKVSVKAYYLTDSGKEDTEDNRTYVPWNHGTVTQGVNLVKDNIKIADADLVEFTTPSGQTSFIGYEDADGMTNKVAYFYLKGKATNGNTYLDIKIKRTNYVTVKTDDGGQETALSYSDAYTTVDVAVVGAGTVTPPAISPRSGNYGKTFDATVKGVKGLKTYYLLGNFSAGTGEISTDGTDETDGEATAGTGQVLPNEIPTGKDFADAVKKYADGHDYQFVAGIMTGDDEEALTKLLEVPGRVGAHYTLYAMSEDEHATDDAKKYSRVVYADYLYNKLANPVLTPGIEGKDHYYTFSTAALQVSARVDSRNAVIYYTKDKALEWNVENGKLTTNATLYNAEDGISVKQSNVIYAIAYNDSLGLVSDVVTYQYAKKTFDLNEPVYVVKGTEYPDGSKYKEPLTGQKVRIKAIVYDEADGKNYTIGGDDAGESSKYHIYFTLDGTNPTVSQDTYTQPADGMTGSKRYTGAFEVDDTKFTGRIIAIVVADGLDASDEGAYSVSDRSVFTAFDPKKAYWETTEENCPLGVLKDKDVELTLNGETVMNVEFSKQVDQGEGGTETTWKHYASNEFATGDPINAIGTYTIAPADDLHEGVAEVRDEMGNYYNHGKAYDSRVGNFQTHKSTFALPAKGAYVKFEPKKDGQLTIWCCQEGALYYSNQSTNEQKFNDMFLRKRPMYFVDEAGKAYPTATDGIECAGGLSANWFTDYNLGHWVSKGGSQNGVEQKLYTQQQTQNIYNMFNSVILANKNKENVGLKDYIVYLNDGTHNEVAGYNVTDDSNRQEGDETAFVPDDVTGAGTGVCLPSASYMKYTFDVKAGKTYFFFGWMTKIGIRGFAFEPSSTTDATPDFTIYTGMSATGTGGDSGDNDFTDKVGKSCAQVTVNRTFKRNLWTPLVLPFSVSATQLKQVLGDKTEVVHYRTIQGTVMYFFQHYHQMLVAGTPVLVKPSGHVEGLDDGAESIQNPEFKNVTIESAEVTDKPSDDYNGGSAALCMVGFYKPTQYANGNYYVNSKGLVTLLNNKNGSSTLPGTRAYIVGENVKLSQMAKTSYDNSVAENMGGATTGIDFIGTGDNAIGTDDGNIYNLNGQLLRKGTTDIEGLAKGVYIVGGQKMVVE